jgi:omega-amidase
MKIGLAQINPLWEDKEKNKTKILDLLKDVDLTSVDLLVFPELTLTGFTMRSRSFAETLDGPSLDFFAVFASSQKSDIIFGLIEKSGENYFNSLIHINTSGEVVAKYRKIHPFSFTGEDRFYAAGSEPVMTKLSGYQFGLSICYDLRFPELFRMFGQQRVAGIINIANWPVQRIDHWSSLLKARAIENLCFVIAVNRVGNDKSNKYNGLSSVYSPTGKPIAQISDTEKVEVVDINLEDVAETRKKFPFLDDIRLI